MTKNGLVQLKGHVVQDAMTAKGLSDWVIHQKTELDLRTVQKAKAGIPVRQSSVMPILALLDLKYHEAVEGVSGDGTKSERELPSRNINEWEPVETLSDWHTTPNGLQYKTWRMVHRHLDNRLARGKQYDLTIPSTKEQDRLRTVLRRHPDVCGRFRGHPQIAMNLTAAPSEHDDQWWVIDEWIAGETLAEALDGGRLAKSRIPRVMLDIALGLQALHGAGIIRRELSPEYILLRETDGSAVLRISSWQNSSTVARR